MTGNRGIIKSLNPVPAAVFIFDCSRLFFLLWLLTRFPMLGLGRVNLPLMMYAAPNALFPLMSFFLLFRFDDFRAYIPLYIIGKILGLICILVWLLFTMRRVPDVSGVMWAVFLCAADIGTVMGTALRDDYTFNRQEEKTDMAAKQTGLTADAAEGGE